MMHDTHLQWPFFEARHEVVAREAAVFAQRHLADGPHPDSAAAVDAHCRSLVTHLGEAGLLEFTARQVLRAPRDAVEPLRLDRMGWHFVHPAPVVDALRSASEAALSDYDQSDALALREELAAALEVAPGALTLVRKA